MARTAAAGAQKKPRADRKHEELGMYTFRCIGSVTTLLTILLWVATISWAGPGDLGTDYEVQIKIGDFTAGAKADSGGTTSLSFADAKAAGLLDADGNPTQPATPSEVGKGPVTIRTHTFSSVSIAVTGKNASGTATGSTQTVTASLVVPQKPANQTGTPAEQTAKTNSLTNKIGKNVVGQVVNGMKLALIDTPTTTPGKNDRGTEWKTASLPAHVIPVTIGSLDPGTPVLISSARLDFLSTDAFLSTLGTTLIPAPVAFSIGLTPVGTFLLDADTQAALFTEGFVSTLPSTPLSLSFGFLDVALPAMDGPFEVTGVAALINPQFDTVVLGGNALIPTSFESFLDNTSSTFALQAVSEPATWVLLSVGLGGLLGYAWQRKKASVRGRPWPLRASDGPNA
jgi:hypothetical protein